MSRTHTSPRPRKHYLLLIAWPVYFASYYLTETCIPASRCTVIHCALDDVIPFCEYFVIPYILWYFLLSGSLLYFLIRDLDSFRRLMKFLIVTMICATTIFIIFPSRQDLRPELFPRKNICTNLVRLLYRIDTNTNVFPSLHVAYSLALGYIWLREKEAPKLWKAFIVVMVLLICLSTVFIKQHSVLDGIAAGVISAAAAIIAEMRLQK